MKNYRDRLVSFTSKHLHVNCEEISSACESYLAALYKAPSSILTLNKFRYRAYNTLVARQKVSVAFDMVALPPQVQLPNSTSNGWALTFKANHWGWKLSSNNLKPVTTEDSSALPFLMQLVFCNYQGGRSASSSSKLYIPVLAINHFAF